MLDNQQLTKLKKKLKKNKKIVDRTEKILLLIIMTIINPITESALDFNPWSDLSQADLEQFEADMEREFLERELGECERLERLHSQELISRADFR